MQKKSIRITAIFYFENTSLTLVEKNWRHTNKNTIFDVT